MDKKRNRLARRLALWSISDQINHEAVDKEVIRFSQVNNFLGEELGNVEKQIKELIVKRANIAKRLINSCRVNIASIEDQTPDSVARPLVDLAFWNRMSDLNPNLYGLLTPRREEIGDEDNEE